MSKARKPSENIDSVQVKAFFALLRSGLYGSPIPDAALPDAIDWEAIVRLARKHTVLGIIIDAVQFLPPQLRPQRPIRAQMNKFALGLIQANIILERSAAQLVDFFSRHRITGVLLKGQGVARYYRQPQMRHSGDIDFYVGDRQYRKAIEVCENGKLLKVPHAQHETSQHINFTLNGIPVELHRFASKFHSPGCDRRFQQWTVEELEHSPHRRSMRVGDLYVTLPSPDFDAIYIFYHAWRHYLEGGIGLRQVCDWVMVLHTYADQIDKEKLEATLRSFRLIKPWKLFAAIAVHHLGLPPGQVPLYDPGYCRRSEKILAGIMEGGNFGFHSEEYIRFKGYGFRGLRYALEKTISYTKSYLSLLPMIPAEATHLYLHRLLNGPLNLLRRSSIMN